MWLLSVVVGITLALQSPLDVRPVPVDGRSIVETFNELAVEPRLLGIFSPTCATCLQTCADLQQLLSEHPRSRLRLLLLWAPFEVEDNVGHARRAAATYLSDPRVVHFWDMWRFGSRAYSNRLRLLPESNWGVVMFFEPGIRWEGEPPPPEFWMQSRRLPVGTPFSLRGLERRLEDWLEEGAEEAQLQSPRIQRAIQK